MLPSKTTFVVGAGASYEVDLPVGRVLRRIISDKLNLQVDDFGHLTRSGDDIIKAALERRHYQESNALSRYLKACRSIRRGLILSRSIDDFIETHQADNDIVTCSKLAIARSILEAERSSKLYYDKSNVANTIDFNRISETWYVAFYQLLSQGVTKADVENLFANVTVISFNYDRCIEHFLLHAITTHYQIDIVHARRLVETLTVFHPYGSVGPYFGTIGPGVEFGFDGLPEFDGVRKNIKTYSEQVENVEELAAIRQAIVKADVLVFLGNAFHTSNMALLFGKTVADNGKKRIYATRRGISDHDLSLVQKHLSRMCKIPLKSILFSETCHQLFGDYSMSLRQ